MKLLDFINSHKSNWEEILTKPPYSLTIKWDGEYCLFKYNMIESDMSLKICQEARGSIFWFNEDIGKWECVCHPFDKFFNVGESNAVEVDWDSSYITEKVDGSLIKFWFHNGVWHISTNGTIDAYKAEVEGFDKTITFGELVDKVLGEEKEKFLDSLYRDCIHMFELISPENRLVVDYGKQRALYYLSSREKGNDKEFQMWTPEIEYMLPLRVHLPYVYHFDSFDEMIECAKTLSKREEGFVVCDKDYNRIKVKGAAYLEAFKIRGNGKLTKKRIVEAIQGDYIDDLIGIVGEVPEIEEVFDELSQYIVWCGLAAALVNEQKFETRKDTAMFVKEMDRHLQPYVFYYLDHHCGGLDFFKQMQINQAVQTLDWVKEVIGKNE